MRPARSILIVVALAAFLALPTLSRPDNPPAIGADKIAEILASIGYNNLWSRSPEGTYYSFYSAKNDASGQGYGFCKDASSGKRESLYRRISEDEQIVLTEVILKAVVKKVKRTIDFEKLEEK
ncbi:hypothetical protein ACFL4G_08450, partial [Thermodesulfobacteriota bacterium]